MVIRILVRLGLRVFRLQKSPIHCSGWKWWVFVALYSRLSQLSGHKYILKIEYADDCNAQPSFKKFLRDRVLFAHNRYPFTPKTNEDLFWGYYVPAVRWYKVADITAAQIFSFELMPRLMHKLNDYKLPFGCHAWEKYDSEFWLEQLGADFLTLMKILSIPFCPFSSFTQNSAL